MSTYDLVDFLHDVEADIAWREEEIRSLDRLIQNESNIKTANSLKRAFITLLYAHSEGGVKTILACYVRVINTRALSVGECIPPLVVAAWSDLFKVISDGSKKHAFFKSRLPDNTKLHRFARQSEFIGNIRTMERLPIVIDHMKVVDTEQNLDEIVLMKILYQLGFPPEALTGRFTDLHFLRELRNYIAHGENTIPTSQQCLKYKKAVLDLFPRLRDLLAKAIRQESYKRESA